MSRICIVAPEFIGPFPNGGVGTACYWEAMTLGSAGHDVTVLYTGPVERETPEYWERHFASTAPFAYTDLAAWMGHHPSLTTNQCDPMCPEILVADAVLAYLRQDSFDLVLFQEFLGHGARAIQAHETGWALTGARTATTLHSCRQWIYEGMHRPPTNAADVAVDFLEKESARTVDRVLAPSRHMAQWARDHWHLDRSIDVVPYCYDAALARPREVLEHAGPFHHLVFFGRLETRKGLHLFCRALAGAPAFARTVERVTFLGKPSSVEGLPSEEFIRRTLAAVPRVTWNIKGDLGSLEALDWLSSQRDVLVVAPSLVDNLPYSLIELHCRRIPFISTHIGGIPEIVGDANHHVLAAPTASGVRDVLARVCRDNRLTVDYGSGYDVASANARHLLVVQELLEAKPRQRTSPARSLTVVVTSDEGTADIETVRSRFVSTDPAAGAAHWVDFETWRARATQVGRAADRSSNGPVLFVHEHVHPDARLLERFLAALGSPGVDAVTSYYGERDSTGGETLVAPLGASLEAGWWHNSFGGPCALLSSRAASAFREALVGGGFTYWLLYAALACRGKRQAIVPGRLFGVSDPGWRTWRHASAEAVVREYHEHAADRIDLGWLLKTAASGIGANVRPGESLGQQFYKQLTSASDAAVAAVAFESGGDPVLRDILTLRDRLMSVAQRWSTGEPRVFVYGAGQHAKLLLQICPELASLVAGFIDRRPLTSFLGRPCLRPEAFEASMADAIVYSSREFEREMHARLQHVPVEHVLLYQPPPSAPEDTTSSRLRRRFGRPVPDFALLHAMYHPPSWATGYISRGDAEFLFEIVAAEQPRTVVELGVASGASSAAILCALDQLPDIGSRVLYSCDVRATCYFDERYATGQACREMYPEARTRWRAEFDTDARRLAHTLPRGSVDLTFIDANHAHPWPLLDLLHVTAVAKPRSWVVLHDVDLPIHYPEYQVYGPRWLFQAWPFNKVKGLGPWVSIAAVQLPDDPAELVAVAERLLARPWEHTPTMWDIDLPRGLEPVQAALARRLAPAAAAATR